MQMRNKNEISLSSSRLVSRVVVSRRLSHRLSTIPLGGKCVCNWGKSRLALAFVVCSGVLPPTRHEIKEMIYSCLNKSNADSCSFFGESP